jgi:hypothetical protein
VRCGRKSLQRPRAARTRLNLVLGDEMLSALKSSRHIIIGVLALLGTVLVMGVVAVNTGFVPLCSLPRETPVVSSNAHNVAVLSVADCGKYKTFAVSLLTPNKQSVQIFQGEGGGAVSLRWLTDSALELAFSGVAAGELPRGFPGPVSFSSTPVQVSAGNGSGAFGEFSRAVVRCR